MKQTNWIVFVTAVFIVGFAVLEVSAQAPDPLSGRHAPMSNRGCGV